MKPFKLNKDQRFLAQRMGEISALAGARRYELVDGKAKGVEAVDIRTGTGFCFTVLPGRGMDLAWADFGGVPISYMSKTGVVSPSYYEPEGVNWLRSFFAGLLTTCGLSNVGWPCESRHPVVGIQKHGLHGRISNSAADQVCVSEGWKEGQFEIRVSGRLREAMLHGENLILHREIVAKLGESRLILRDTVENVGFTDQTMMILYHINIGYPILDASSRLVGPILKSTPADDEAAKNQNHFSTFGPPTAGFREHVYFHEFRADAQGKVRVGIVNPELELAVYVRFSPEELPRFTQWKMLSEAEYVLGLEPGNCGPIGREEQERRGGLDSLKPGETRTIELEIGVLTDAGEIDDLVRSSTI